MKVKNIVPILLAALLLCSCSKPEAVETPPQSGSPAPSVTGAPTTATGQVTVPENISDALYDAYSAARRQITRHYSEYVSNYERTFGESKEVKLPKQDSADPYINISIPVLIDVDRESFDQTLKKPLETQDKNQQLSGAYKRLYESLAPLEAAYKSARDYYLEGGAQEDNFSNAQALHDSMRKCSDEFTAALDEFSSQLRALEKVRRHEKLKALLDNNMPVRYNVENMLAYAGDISSFLKEFDDENPYYKGDAETMRPLYDDFAKYADAVLDYTGEDMIKEGFKEEFSHTFPSFFSSVQKMRLIAQNVLIIMEKQDMNAPLPTLPPDADNLGMAPEDAIRAFAENYATAGKLYKAFTAVEDE